MKIGLEVHVQMSTRTKLFCGCPNKFTDKPNVHTCDYCLGFPGTKPRLNEKAVEYALKIATALSCKVPGETFFSRKTYFYPDMGKNFQITQYEVPIGENGHVTLANKKITIERINIEEDPARIVHVSGNGDMHRQSASITSAEYLLLDYNRSGAPLCEIVTAPEFATAREARMFLQKLSSILQYLDVYDPDVEGTMRVDANISLGSSRVEVKNISGFKEVERALAYEIIRQKNLIGMKKEVERETRGWDADAGITRSLRTKETEEDYGYIFEADLPRVTISKKKLAEIRKSMPELADEKLERYVKEMKIGYDLATSIVSDPEIARMFEDVAKQIDVQLAAKWFAGEIKKTLNYNTIRLRDTKLRTEHVVKLLSLVKEKKLTDTTAELILREMVARKDEPEKLLQRDSVERIYSEDILVPFVQSAMDEHPNAIIDYKSGKSEALNFLVGQVMRKTSGRADSETVRRLLKGFLK